MKYFVKYFHLILVELHGPCKFTGADISNVAKMFEVLNPDHHIATITEEKTLVFEIRISRGKGYSPAIKNKRTKCFEFLYEKNADLSVSDSDGFTPRRFINIENWNFSFL